MSLASVGDLSRAYALRTANSRTKSLLTTLSRELSTGVKADLPKALGGDTRRLSSIEHRLRTLETLQRNCQEVGGRLDAGQAAMAGMQAIASRTGTALLGASMMTGTQAVDTLLSDARSNLEATIGLLNTEYAGESIFAGSRVGARPVADAGQLLAEVGAATAGRTDMGDIIAAVDAFFDAPAGGGGYTDRLYLGGATGRGAVPVSPERSVGSEVTAAAPPFRELLKGLALASLAAEGTIGATDTDRLLAAQAAGARIKAAESGLIDTQSARGVLQESVEQARSRNAAEISSLQIARTEVVGADPYDTAAALAEVEAQMQALYAVTARLSQLSLVKRL